MKSRDKTTEKALNKLSLHLKRERSMQPKTQERKKVEMKLKNTGDFLHNIIESSLDGIIATDDKGCITRANKAFLELLKYGEDDVVGKHITELSISEEGVYELNTGDSVVITKEYFDKQVAMIASLLEGAEIRNRKSYFVRSDGKIVPCEQNISALYDDEGKINGAVGIIRDIIQRKKVEEELKETKDHLDNLIESSLDGIAVSDHLGFINRVNRSFQELIGFEENAIIGKHITEFTPYEEGTYESIAGELVEINERFLNAQLEVTERLFKEGKVFNWESYYLRKDRKLVPVEMNIAYLYDKEGNVTGSVGINRDITERKKAEQKIREAKDYLDNAIENSIDAIIITDNNGYLVKANRSFVQLIGCKEEEVIGKHIGEFTILEEGTYESTTGESVKIGSKYFDDITIFLEKLVDEGKLPNHESYKMRSDKKIVPIESNTALLYNEKKEQIGAIGVIRNITERKKAEREIREAKEFLENIFRTTTDGILVTNNDGVVTVVNEATARILGYCKEEIVGKGANIFEPEGEEYGKVSSEYVKKLLEEGTVAGFEFIWVRKDGNLINVEVNTALLKDNDVNITGAVSTIRDITERKEFEERLKKSEEKFRGLIENANDAIISINANGIIIDYNEMAAKIFGYSSDEILGEPTHLLLPLDEREEWEKSLKQFRDNPKTSFPRRVSERKGLRKDGKEISIESSTFYLETQGEYILTSFVRDITERKEMESKLLQSEKLKSLGELAGGVGHDFNNVLAAILGRAQLLKMQFEPPPGKQEKRKSILDLMKSLEIIERASSDGAETVRRIQEFSRKRSDDKEFAQVDINRLIENSLEFTSVRWKDAAESKGININIEKEFSSLPMILGSASELREVLTNIINNAVDAMPQGGKIQIKTSMENNQISITIKDSGIGIPEDIRKRIFDPFFTTKGVQSTGLGMSTSYGIINRHKGTILVDSTEGEGTTFTIKLPISSSKLEMQEKTKPILEEKREATILVIEDEEEVRNLLADILIESGHHVETAPDGNQGIELFKEKDFDLVFTDLGMPGMSGWQVAETVKNINSKTPVAIITGWNVELEESEMREKGVNLIVHKPFEINQILNLVQEGMELRERFEAA